MSGHSAENSLHEWLVFLTKAVVVGLAAAFVIMTVRQQWRPNGDSQELLSYAQAVDKAAPAVVYIFTTNPVSVPSLTDPLNRQALISREVTTNLGSGVIIREDGLIVTNEHLLRGSQNIYVLLHDGNWAAAAIVGIDPDTDLALLRVDANDLPVITMGRSDKLHIGDVVLAIGNPFGLGQTVTQGIVSATGRDQLNLNPFENFVQTDASINPGNSGGALVDTRGHLVGINSAVINPAGAEGIGFAIPVNLVRGVTDQLLANGRVIRGWLGLSAQPLPVHLQKFAGIEHGGILVTQIYAGSPAHQAGIRGGDIIIAVDDQQVSRVKDALNRVARLAPGDQVRLSILRANGRSMERLETEIRVTERPVDSNGAG